MTLNDHPPFGPVAGCGRWRSLCNLNRVNRVSCLLGCHFSSPLSDLHHFFNYTVTVNISGQIYQSCQRHSWLLQAKVLFYFQYNSIDNSPVSQYITHPFWNWVVEVSFYFYFMDFYSCCGKCILLFVKNRHCLRYMPFLLSNVLWYDNDD